MVGWTCGSSGRAACGGIYFLICTPLSCCIIGRRVNKINWVTRSCGCLCASRPACTSGTSCCHRDETTCGRQSLHLLKGRVRVMSGKERALRLLQLRHGCLHQHHTPHICELPAHLKQGFHAFKSRFGLKRSFCRQTGGLPYLPLRARTCAFYLRVL